MFLFYILFFKGLPLPKYFEIKDRYPPSIKNTVFSIIFHRATQRITRDYVNSIIITKLLNLSKTSLFHTSNIIPLLMGRVVEMYFYEQVYNYSKAEKDNSSKH